MIRSVFNVLRSIRPVPIQYYNAARIITVQPNQNYSILSTKNNTGSNVLSQGSLVNNNQVLDISKSIIAITPVRTVTKFSLKKGKRKTVKAAVKRFLRLEWGGWIRTKIGRHKRLWKKSQAQKRRLRQHVFCNATQSTLLDKMVTSYWKKPKHYVDDPYAPYHTREEFAITRKKPRDIY